MGQTEGTKRPPRHLFLNCEVSLLSPPVCPFTHNPARSPPPLSFRLMFALFVTVYLFLETLPLVPLTLRFGALLMPVLHHQIYSCLCSFTVPPSRAFAITCLHLPH